MSNKLNVESAFQISEDEDDLSNQNKWIQHKIELKSEKDSYKNLTKLDSIINKSNINNILNFAKIENSEKKKNKIIKYENKDEFDKNISSEKIHISSNFSIEELNKLNQVRKDNQNNKNYLLSNTNKTNIINKNTNPDEYDKEIIYDKKIINKGNLDLSQNVLNSSENKDITFPPNKNPFEYIFDAKIKKDKRNSYKKENYIEKFDNNITHKKTNEANTNLVVPKNNFFLILDKTINHNSNKSVKNTLKIKIKKSSEYNISSLHKNKLESLNIKSNNFDINLKLAENLKNSIINQKSLENINNTKNSQERNSNKKKIPLLAKIEKKKTIKENIKIIDNINIDDDQQPFDNISILKVSIDEKISKEEKTNIFNNSIIKKNSFGKTKDNGDFKSNLINNNKINISSEINTENGELVKRSSISFLNKKEDDVDTCNYEAKIPLNENKNLEDINPAKNNNLVNQKSTLLYFKDICRILSKRKFDRLKSEIKYLVKFLNSNFKFFKKLSNEKEYNSHIKLEACAVALNIQFFEGGEKIVNCGEQANSFFIILQGRIKVNKPLFIEKEMSFKAFVEYLFHIKNIEKDQIKLDRVQQANITNINLDHIKRYNYDVAKFSNDNFQKKFYIEENNTVAYIKEGGEFGEIGLIYDCKRTATIEADCKTIVAFIERNEYNKAYYELQEKYYTKKILEFKNNYHAFRDMRRGFIYRLLNLVETVDVTVGDVIYEQNTISDAIYIAVEGTYDISSCISLKTYKSFLEYVKDQKNSLVNSMIKSKFLLESQFEEMRKNSDKIYGFPPSQFSRDNHILDLEAKSKTQKPLDIKMKEEVLKNTNFPIRVLVKLIEKPDIIGLEEVLELKRRYYTVKCTSSHGVLYKIDLKTFFHLINKEEISKTSFVEFINQRKKKLFEQVHRAIVVKYKSLDKHISHNYNSIFSKMEKLETTDNEKINNSKIEILHKEVTSDKELIEIFNSEVKNQVESKQDYFNEFDEVDQNKKRCFSSNFNQVGLRNRNMDSPKKIENKFSKKVKNIIKNRNVKSADIIGYMRKSKFEDNLYNKCDFSDNSRQNNLNYIVDKESLSKQKNGNENNCKIINKNFFIDFEKLTNFDSSVVKIDNNINNNRNYTSRNDVLLDSKEYMEKKSKNDFSKKSNNVNNYTSNSNNNINNCNNKINNNLTINSENSFLLARKNKSKNCSDDNSIKIKSNEPSYKKSILKGKLNKVNNSKNTSKDANYSESNNTNNYINSIENKKLINLKKENRIFSSKSRISIDDNKDSLKEKILKKKILQTKKKLDDIRRQGSRKPSIISNITNKNLNNLSESENKIMQKKQKRKMFKSKSFSKLKLYERLTLSDKEQFINFASSSSNAREKFKFNQKNLNQDLKNSHPELFTKSKSEKIKFPNFINENESKDKKDYVTNNSVLEFENLNENVLSFKKVKEAENPNNDIQNNNSSYFIIDNNSQKQNQEKNKTIENDKENFLNTNNLKIADNDVSINNYSIFDNISNCNNIKNLVYYSGDNTITKSHRNLNIETTNNQPKSNIENIEGAIKSPREIIYENDNEIIIGSKVDLFSDVNKLIEFQINSRTEKARITFSFSGIGKFNKKGSGAVGFKTTKNKKNNGFNLLKNEKNISRIKHSKKASSAKYGSKIYSKNEKLENIINNLREDNFAVERTNLKKSENINFKGSDIKEKEKNDYNSGITDKISINADNSKIEINNEKIDDAINYKKKLYDESFTEKYQKLNCLYIDEATKKNIILENINRKIVSFQENDEVKNYNIHTEFKQQDTEQKKYINTNEKPYIPLYYFDPHKYSEEIKKKTFDEIGKEITKLTGIQFLKKVNKLNKNIFAEKQNMRMLKINPYCIDDYNLSNTSRNHKTNYENNYNNISNKDTDSKCKNINSSIYCGKEKRKNRIILSAEKKVGDRSLNDKKSVKNNEENPIEDICKNNKEYDAIEENVDYLISSNNQNFDDNILKKEENLSAKKKTCKSTSLEQDMIKISNMKIKNSQAKFIDNNNENNLFKSHSKEFRKGQSNRKNRDDPFKNFVDNYTKSINNNDSIAMAENLDNENINRDEFILAKKVKDINGKKSFHNKFSIQPEKNNHISEFNNKRSLSNIGITNDTVQFHENIYNTPDREFVENLNFHNFKNIINKQNINNNYNVNVLKSFMKNKENEKFKDQFFGKRNFLQKVNLGNSYSMNKGTLHMKSYDDNTNIYNQNIKKDINENVYNENEQYKEKKFLDKRKTKISVKVQMKYFKMLKKENNFGNKL